MLFLAAGIGLVAAGHAVATALNEHDEMELTGPGLHRTSTLAPATSYAPGWTPPPGAEQPVAPGLVDIDPHRSTVTDALDNLLDLAHILCRGAHAKLYLDPVVPAPLDPFLGVCDVPLRVPAQQAPRH